MCPIDREPFNDNDNIMIINHCKHVFRENNLREWFTRSSYCPLCRHNISENNTTSNQQNISMQNTRTQTSPRQNEILDTFINNTMTNFTNTLINNLPRDLSNSITTIQYDVFSPTSASDINLDPLHNNIIQRRDIIFNNNLSFSRDLSNNNTQTNNSINTQTDEAKKND